MRRHRERLGKRLPEEEGHKSTRDHVPVHLTSRPSKF
jgi:hypothetical protein